MGTLTMALAAALLAGSGPEKVSGDVEQRLNLSGEWEGTWQDGRGLLSKATLKKGSRPDGRRIEGESAGDPGIAFLDLHSMVDEGNGRLRIELPKESSEGGDGFLGIYRIQGDQVYLCYRWASEGYPKALRGGQGQNLLVLRRGRLRK